MPFVATPRLTFHYETAGAGGEPLLLVHGNFASWRWWRPVLDRLPSGYRAYAPDLRGCGDSSRTSGGYSIPELATDLHAFAAALDLPPLHLVGHSLGGAVALQFTLNHPAQVRTLLLLAPSPAEGMPIFRAARSRPSWLARLFDLHRVLSLAQADAAYRFLRTLGADRALLRRGLERVTPTLRRDRAFEALVDDAARMSPEAAIGHVRALGEWNVQAQLGRLDLPVLILWGAKDILVPRAGLERTARGLRRGQLVVWPDVGHAPQLEQPDRFARLLFNFTARRPIPSAPPGWLRRLWAKLPGATRRLL
jgi:pimeloyl-ACP methyl ester carboxylesterase